jgi:hypothetical protein
MADGVRSECKVWNLAQRARRCAEEVAFRHRDIDRVKRWRLDNPDQYADLNRRLHAKPGYKEVMWRSHLKRKYGIALEDYDE